jgi:beta-glucosidase
MTNINKLIHDLTLREKISLMSGFNSWYTNKIDRLGIPSIKMSDGPNGVRGDSNSGKSSACFPCAISIGSTWDMDLINQLGIALGEEAKVKDVDVLLGPTINIHRHPLGGRHFESFSEDPFLTGKIATEYVKGVQSQDVAACLKHFIGNDTEYERHLVSSNIDEKTLREIYLLPFEMGIKEGNAQVVMSAYNKLNNIYCSSHKELLIDILKDEWGFDGYVVSDWGAALETEENAKGGLDLEMPGPGNVWGDQLFAAVSEGKVEEELIDDKVRRILNIANFSKRFENPTNKPEQSNNSEEHRKLLKKAAASGMVLLKNNDLLPLKSNVKNLAIIGPNAKEAQIIGGGSASLKPHYQAHPLEAFQNKLGDHTNISYAKGCHTHKFLPRVNEGFMDDKEGFLVEYFEGSNFDENLLVQEHLIGNKFWVFEGFAKDVIAKFERPDISVRFSCAYTPDISGQHEFEIFGIGKARLFIDGEELIDNWTETSPGEAFFSFSSDSKRALVNLIEGTTYQLEIRYKFEGNFPAIYIGCQAPDKVNLFDEALEVASAADQVILIVGTNSDWETEGNDRSDFNLPVNQNHLIEEVLRVNPNTLVVLNTGSPVKMPWADKAEAIMQTWFAGQEFGNALVDIITGEINPSGRLPTSFPKNIEDTPAFNSYPGKDLQMNYDEKLLVGYRWYDKKNIKTLFPFGHGLSYTNFEYSDLEVDVHPKNMASCKFSVRNTGQVAGIETAQCYVSFKTIDDSEPEKTLQGFSKIALNPNDESSIEINLNSRNFSSWNVAKRSWEVRAGSYEILIGSSAENILLQTTINL